MSVFIKWINPVKVASLETKILQYPSDVMRMVCGGRHGSDAEKQTIMFTEAQ